jgi:sphinganine-1-phosphate aldolase
MDVKAALFRFAKKHIPQVRAHVDKELDKMRVECVTKYRESRIATALYNMPQDGRDVSEIMDRIKTNAQYSRRFYTDGGNITGAVYNNDDNHWNFIADVMRETIVSNPLHIDEFLYVTQMEAEIIRWTLNLYNGDENCCGIVTSGGTESIILAMLAYREQGLHEKGITKPNMVMSETAHCAFDKGGFYYGIEVRKVPITKDFMCDVAAMKRNIDKNTIALVASAPEYAFGNYEPVAEICELAKPYGIGVHVDCCLGSYVNPFIKKLGYKLAYEHDFKIKGVTSMSCDPHKYAYGPKGTSICMFRSKRLREYQFFCNTSWNGGLYATTCIAGSRPGCTIAATWASMLKHGVKGYEAKAKKILEAQV